MPSLDTPAAHAIAPRVVVIDDDRLVRDSMCVYLEDIGYTVVPAASAREGLNCCRDEQPDPEDRAQHVEIAGAIECGGGRHGQLWSVAKGPAITGRCFFAAFTFHDLAGRACRTTVMPSVASCPACG